MFVRVYFIVWKKCTKLALYIFYESKKYKLIRFYT